MLIGFAAKAKADKRGESGGICNADLLGIEPRLVGGQKGGDWVELVLQNLKGGIAWDTLDLGQQAESVGEVGRSLLHCL